MGQEKRTQYRARQREESMKKRKRQQAARRRHRRRLTLALCSGSNRTARRRIIIHHPSLPSLHHSIHSLIQKLSWRRGCRRSTRICRRRRSRLRLFPKCKSGVGFSFFASLSSLSSSHHPIISANRIYTKVQSV